MGAQEASARRACLRRWAPCGERAAAGTEPGGAHTLEHTHTLSYSRCASRGVVPFVVWRQRRKGPCTADRAPSPVSSRRMEEDAWAPLGAGDFGAELRGAAASALLARWRAGHASTLSQLRTRLARHGVLALRPDACSGDGDDAASILGLAEQLGRPRPTPSSACVTADGASRASRAEQAAASQSAVLRVVRSAEDTGQQIFGEQWHRDCSFCQDALPHVTLWRAVQIPPAPGGRTLFACMAAFLDALPPPLAAELRRCDAVHSAINRRLLPPGSEAAAAGASRSCRPALGQHPVDGRSYADVCDGFSEELRAAAGSQPGAAAAMPALLDRVLEELHAWAGSGVADVVDWQWRSGDVVLLDNVRCVHLATGGVEGHRRELHRVLVDGCWA